MSLLSNVKSLAKKRGLSIEQVAKKASELNDDVNISRSSLYKWDDHEPKPSAVKAVADVLGVSVDYLLGNTDEMHPTDNRSVEQKLSDEGLAIATYIDPNAELDDKAMENIKNYIYEQTMLAKMRIDKERAQNGK